MRDGSPANIRPVATYDPPLDAGIRAYVEALGAAGVETFESCEGGTGHAYPEPTIRFHGGQGEGFRALAVAQREGLPVAELRRTWPVLDDEPTGPWWELTFSRRAMSEIRVQVDFNGFAADGRLPVLAAHANGPLVPGGTVIVEEGADRARATVDEVRSNGLAYLSVDWSTWNRVKPVFVVHGLPSALSRLIGANTGNPAGSPLSALVSR